MNILHKLKQNKFLQKFTITIHKLFNVNVGLYQNLINWLKICLTASVSFESFYKKTIIIERNRNDNFWTKLKNKNNNQTNNKLA